jgi:hypothetical protein
MFSNFTPNSRSHAASASSVNGGGACATEPLSSLVSRQKFMQIPNGQNMAPLSAVTMGQHVTRNKQFSMLLEANGTSPGRWKTAEPDCDKRRLRLDLSMGFLRKNSLKFLLSSCLN